MSSSCACPKNERNSESAVDPLIPCIWEAASSTSPAMGFKVIACMGSPGILQTAINARLRAVAKPIENAALGPLFRAL